MSQGSGFDPGALFLGVLVLAAFWIAMATVIDCRNDYVGHRECDKSGGHWQDATSDLFRDNGKCLK